MLPTKLMLSGPRQTLGWELQVRLEDQIIGLNTTIFTDVGCPNGRYLEGGFEHCPVRS